VTVKYIHEQQVLFSFQNTPYKTDRNKISIQISGIRTKGRHPFTR